MTTEPDDEPDGPDMCPVRAAMEAVDRRLAALFAAIDRADALADGFLAKLNAPRPPDEPAR